MSRAVQRRSLLVEVKYASACQSTSRQRNRRRRRGTSDAACSSAPPSSEPGTESGPSARPAACKSCSCLRNGARGWTGKERSQEHPLMALTTRWSDRNWDRAQPFATALVGIFQKEIAMPQRALVKHQRKQHQGSSSLYCDCDYIRNCSEEMNSGFTADHAGSFAPLLHTCRRSMLIGVC